MHSYGVSLGQAYPEVNVVFYIRLVYIYLVQCVSTFTTLTLAFKATISPDSEKTD